MLRRITALVLCSMVMPFLCGCPEQSETNLGDSVQEAAEEVKDEAQDAVEQVKDEVDDMTK